MAKKALKKIRLIVDWNSIHPNYVLGTMSNLGIVKQYEADHVHSTTFKKTVSEGAIRKAAKERGWKKDIAGAVQKKIKENLVRAEVRSTNQKSDDEIINEASESGVSVVMSHREDIRGLQGQEKILLDKLSKFYEDSDSIKKKLDLNGLDNTELIKILSREPVVLKTCSQIVKNISDIMVKRIALERQAHNIDSDGGNEDPLKDLKDDQLLRRIKLFEAKFNK